ncbi:HIT domain-containing protein [Thalassomonas viridans]|uniref:HIT domain-containing protein n=1 Tax=Thalassomonas viridans TaxID=137584 RepID=A0AAE9Z5U7_9GAMM|nr:HIT domain-containing protein [Thalassomonas viridans]WDE06590.1 HIT domain-containing protein [Thalassomonas viridans]
MSETFTLDPQLANDSIELMDFPLCKLLLANDSNYPWFILVPKVAGITEVFQLEWQDQQQLLNESSLLSEFLLQEFGGDKMNVAALGNVVEQLHLHHVVRFNTDISWPKPIWGQHLAAPYSSEDLAGLKARLVPKLASILPG